MPQMEKFGKASATTTVTSAPGSSSRARKAALMPASLPPIMTRCMTGFPFVWWLTEAGAGRTGRAGPADGAGGCSVAGHTPGGLLIPVLMVGDDDLRRLRWGETRIQCPDHQHGERTADDLGGDERRDRRGGDAGEGVREHPPDGDRRVGEAGRGGEEVRRADVGADRRRGGPGPARA